MKDIHRLYVNHLLSGSGPVVSSGGTILTFAPMHGSGWLSDKLKSAWGHVKGFANNYVKPLVLQHGKDALNEAAQVLRQNAREAVKSDLLSDEPLSIRERLARARGTLNEGVRHDLRNLKDDHKRMLKEHILNQLR